ncbi:MAG: dihydropteroate synthase [Acidobacteriota bacterium]
MVNITPDSFSDGGRFFDPGAAVQHGLEMLEQGADLIDLGAESTRPGGSSVYGAGASDVPAEEELRRLLPVLRGLRRQTTAPLSVDTRKAAVAQAALDEGADLVNDVSALGDPEMGALLSQSAVPVILMHSRGTLDTMQRDIRFDDVVGEVRAELAAVADRAVAAGIARERLILDPGIGFGKTAEQNLQLLREVAAFTSLGRPLLIGASRKSFLGHVTGAPPAARLPGSLAAAAWAALSGVSLLRVHDVAETVQFLRVLASIGAPNSAESAP